MQTWDDAIVMVADVIQEMIEMGYDYDTLEELRQRIV